jgi:hypothetical protein
MPPTTTALDALRTCGSNLLTARQAALDAATGLAGDDYRSRRRVR